ncbi:AAA family ATPase [Acidithiobacillus sp.]|uniref:AAA family ATPase n=1 Tax=Acidithiobacillus sp. TaxID=1872118 RepID=UPI003CFEE54D
MSDITSILGGEWSPPAPPPKDPPDIQIKDAMLRMGINPPEHIFIDGQLHRFNSGTKGKPGHDKPGWYVVFQDINGCAGRFGCWRAGLDMIFHEDIGRPLTTSEEMGRARRVSEARTIRDAEAAKLHDAVEKVVDAIWSEGAMASADHPYLSRKGIAPHGARVTGDGRLMVPLYGADGKLQTIQYIEATESGSVKRYHLGSSTRGASWMIGTLDDYHTLYIAEGYATAATIHEATGQPCVVAYSASNLPAIANQYKSCKKVVIVADNDASGTGQSYADQASALTGASVIIPPDHGDANDYRQSGGDLLALLQPQTEEWLQPADDFCQAPAPIRWLVKHWLQDQGLIMVHGPSGGGKTFAVLDWCLHIAAGLPDWNGHKVRHGDVIYLAGEGHHGLRGRVAAWKQEHPCDSLKMWISRAGCDLNTKTGHQLVRTSIHDSGAKPSIIVVDTLHRFLLGDENSAQDAKTMLDACALLMREFTCTVILVHHTGVSDEAQHRARGSSAWRGALDGEISIIPPTRRSGDRKNDGPIEIAQRKAKDSEEAPPVFVTLKSVPITGWFDEDGEQVTSAVIEVTEAPTDGVKEAPWRAHLKRFERAWFRGGCEEREGMPYVSRSALRSLLCEVDGVSEKVANNYMVPSSDKKMIGCLIAAEIIKIHENGWMVINDLEATAILVRK